MSFELISILFNLNSNTKSGSGAGYINTTYNGIMSNYQSNGLPYTDTETNQGIHDYENYFTIEDIFNWK